MQRGLTRHAGSMKPATSAPTRERDTPKLDISPHTLLAFHPRLPTTGVTHSTVATSG